MRNFKMYSLCTFQIYCPALLSIDTMLHLQRIYLWTISQFLIWGFICPQLPPYRFPVHPLVSFPDITSVWPLEWVIFILGRGGKIFDSSGPWSLGFYVLSMHKKGASLLAQLVKNPLQCRRPQFYSWVGKIPWRKDRLLTSAFMGLPGGSDSQESSCNAGYLGSVPGLGRALEGGHGNPL